jgi:hypothetical protein
MELIEGVTFKRLMSLLQQHQQKLTTAQAALRWLSRCCAVCMQHTPRSRLGDVNYKLPSTTTTSPLELLTSSAS